MGNTETVLYTISEVIECYISGDWGNDCASEDAQCAVSCIRGADIVPILNSEFSEIPLRYISSKSFSTRALQEGDIVIEKSGGSPTQSTGRVVYVSKELLAEKKRLVCSNFCAAFRIKPEWDSKYVFFYLQHIYNAGVFFNFEGKTSGLKNLIMDTAFQSITIKRIAIEEQRSIAKILSTIDSKTAANRAINKNLEAMAKQLYDYWFVQFDFPDENGRPYKSSGGKMVWNERLKRDIPSKWNDGVLEDIANVTMGQSPDGASYNEKGEGTIFYQGSTDFGLRFPSVRVYTTAPARYARKGDILMSVRAPVGAVNIANTDCCIGRGLSAINSKIGSITYTYFVIHYLRVRFDKLNSAGTTFGAITKDELLKLPVCVPSSTVIEQFEKLCKPIFDKQMEIGLEINELIKQRDELLPLLMNGQVSVNSD